MLIEFGKRSVGLSSEDFPTPVVGGIGTSIPTSADIHLYADPKSQYTQFPRLYADCEGLRGGEKDPMAHRAMEGDSSRTETKKKFERSLDDEYLRRFQERAQGSKRRKLDFAENEEARKREYTVREFYPRFLYTFSHVVVFVLHNERSVDTILLITASLLLISGPHSGHSKMDSFAYYSGLQRLLKAQPIKAYCPMQLSSSIKVPLSSMTKTLMLKWPPKSFCLTPTSP